MSLNNQNQPKRAYAAPKLTIYGDMASLTRNQSGSISEGAGGPTDPMGSTTMA